MEVGGTSCAVTSRRVQRRGSRRRSSRSTRRPTVAGGLSRPGTIAWTLQTLDTKDGTMTAASQARSRRRSSRRNGPRTQSGSHTWSDPDDPMRPDLAGTFEVHVVDVKPSSSTAGDAEPLLVKVEGQKPVLSWSADSRRLAVRTPTHETKMAELAGDALLVDADTGTSEPVGFGDVVYAGFSPVDPATYAYATPEALFVATIGGQPRKVADVPSGPLCDSCSDGPVSRWPGGEWMGWSPDGSCRRAGHVLGRGGRRRRGLGRSIGAPHRRRQADDHRHQVVALTTSGCEHNPAKRPPPWPGPRATGTVGAGEDGATVFAPRAAPRTTARSSR